MELNPTAAGFDRSRLERITEHLERSYITPGKIAGCQALVARRGHVAYFRSLGQMDRERARPMQDDTIFRLYSMTKPVTSVALLMLYEEGKFQLDDPIAKYLPELAGLKLYVGEGNDGNMIVKDPARQPTVHDVFRHTAGFLYGGNGDRGIDRAYSEADLMNGTLAELTRKLGKIPLAYEPGTQWVYSVSHDVQARLVEVLSGMPFDEFAQRRIFDPLGMKNTVFGRPGQWRTEQDRSALERAGAGRVTFWLEQLELDGIRREMDEIGRSLALARRADS